MKKLVLSLIIIFSLLFTATAQNIIITDADVNACSGIFWDSGLNDNYSQGENEMITICSNTGGAINFDFIDFNLGSSSDVLSIYDGPSTDAPLIANFTNANSLEGVTISSTETCLTFVFSSSSWGGGGEGWAATMSCSFPCQEFEVEVQTDIEANEEGVYVMCPADIMEFEVGVSFPNNNEDYFQSISNTTFSWTSNNGASAFGQNISFFKYYSQFEIVSLVVEDVNGCTVKKEFVLKSECQIYDNQILVDGSSPEYEEIYIPNGQSVNLSVEDIYPENNTCYDQSYTSNYMKIGENDFIEITESLDYIFPEGSTQTIILRSIDTLGCWAHDTLEIHIGCQPIEVEFESDHPIVNGAIVVCINDTFSIEANTTYNYNDILYYQQDNNTIFNWDLFLPDSQGDIIVNTVFSNQGLQQIELEMIDNNDCIDREIAFVNVIQNPETIELNYNQDTICLGDSLLIKSEYEISSSNIGNFFPIPDGSGVSYMDQILVMDHMGMITNTTDFESICINIEHSYTGDLDIKLICPSGQSLDILNYPNNCGGSHLGEPCDVSGTSTIGNGYEYCFTYEGNFTIPETSNLYNHTYIDNDGNTISRNYFPAGDYDVMGDFEGLIGCPFNGAWTLQITDNLASDDGHIFSWALNFSEQFAEEESGIWEENWSVESESPADFVSMNDSTLFIPQDSGTYYIHYELTNIAGCGMDTVIGPITVLGTDLVLGIVGDNEVINGDIEVYSLATESTNIVEWYVDGGTIIETYSGDSIKVEWTSEAGYVMVTAENMNGCNSFDIMYMNSTEIVDLKQSDIKLYPNPSQGHITIEMDSEQNINFAVINASGALVLQDQLKGKETRINLSHLSTGMYLILINGQYAKKLILE